jgi:hypothetical protein
VIKPKAVIEQIKAQEVLQDGAPPPSGKRFTTPNMENADLGISVPVSSNISPIIFKILYQSKSLFIVG